VLTFTGNVGMSVLRGRMTGAENCVGLAAFGVAIPLYSLSFPKKF